MTQRLLILLLPIVIAVSGCNLVYKQNIQQGNAIEQEDLDKLRLGMSQNQVAFLLGTPSIQDPFHHDRWDYVSSFSRRGEPAVMRKVTLYFEGGSLSEMIGVEADEFIFEEEEMSAEPVADDETVAEITPLATPSAEQTDLATDEGWTLQLGVYDAESNADELLERLDTAGYAGRMTTETGPDGRSRYLVLMGGFSTREEALDRLAEMQDELGINGFVQPRP